MGIVALILSNLWLTLAAAVLVILIVAALLSLKAVRRTLRFIITSPMALVLVTVGLVMTIIWRPVRWLTDHLLKWIPADRWIERLPDRLAGKARFVEDKELREQMAHNIWPRDQFPELYQAVPADMARPLFEDGRLVGGLPLRWLADRHMTDAAQKRCIRLGIALGLVFALVVLALPLFRLLYDLVLFIPDLFSGNRPVSAQWPGMPAVHMPMSTFVWINAQVGGDVLWVNLLTVLRDAPSAILGGSGIALLSGLLLLAMWFSEATRPFRLITKDADVRWAYRGEDRENQRRAYRRQIAQATGYLKNSATYLVGNATGTLRLRGDLAAPLPDQELRLDKESLFQHLLVFGGTGEGKTTAMLKPLMRQVLADKRFGAFVVDAKGVLWKDALKVAKDLGREKDVIVLGTGKGQYGINIVEGLTPSQICSVMNSVIVQLGGNSGGSFWSDMASNLLRHLLTLGLAYAETPKGREEAVNPYSLWWAYTAALDPDRAKEAIDAVRQAYGEETPNAKKATAAKAATPEPQRKRGPLPADTDPDELPVGLDPAAQEIPPSTEDAPEVEKGEGAEPHPAEPRELPTVLAASISYIETSWPKIAEQTRSGIIANLTQALDGFAGAPDLLMRFAAGRKDDTIRLDEALNGKIVVSALSTIEDGLPARICSILIKTTLYRAARMREAQWKVAEPPRNPQDHPCLVVMDEVQELVTSDLSSGLSDANFWNVARSSGLAGVFATQTISALMSALGEKPAENFIQQARSKVFFRTEEEKTVNYACWCAGSYERNRVVEDEHRESIEHRLLLDGWDPFAPVPDTDGPEPGPRALIGAAFALMSPGTTAFQVAPAATYAADRRFMPRRPVLAITQEDRARDHAAYMAQLGHEQAAAWRAEDLTRNYRMQGNASQPALTPSDMMHMGRWHAFAQVQRAGALRQDIVAVEHDFG